jgi:hypothetical protein
MFFGFANITFEASQNFPYFLPTLVLLTKDVQKKTREEKKRSSERQPNTYNDVILFFTQNLRLSKVSNVGFLSSNIVARAMNKDAYP